MAGWSFLNICDTNMISPLRIELFTPILLASVRVIDELLLEDISALETIIPLAIQNISLCITIKKLRASAPSSCQTRFIPWL
jgi:hypothetical protein